MIVGCYHLCLYCERKSAAHEFDEFPHEFTAEFGSECRAQARLKGWKLNKDGTAICPKCNKRGKNEKTQRRDAAANHAT